MALVSQLDQELAMFGKQDGGVIGLGKAADEYVFLQLLAKAAAFADRHYPAIAKISDYQIDRLGWDLIVLKRIDAGVIRDELVDDLILLARGVESLVRLFQAGRINFRDMARCRSQIA